VQNNLEKLRIDLDSRNTTRGRIAELESSAESPDTSKMAELEEKLERREASLEKSRGLVRRELADAKKARDDAQKHLEKARENNTFEFETAEEQRLKAAIVRGDMLVDHLQRALAAEEGGTVTDILASIQEEASKIGGPFSLDSSRFGDWPGPSSSAAVSCSSWLQ